MEKIRTSIWVISLPESAERRNQFERSVTCPDLPWAFFDAHRQASPDLQYDPEVVRAHFGRELRAGEIGCYSSHFALWQQLLSDDSADQYLVMEDDIIVDWDTVSRIIRHDFGSDGVDFVRLFYKFPSRHRIRRRGYTGQNVFLLQLYDTAWGTQAYVVNKAAAKKFIDSMGVMKRPIDVAMDRYWENDVRNLCLFPFPVVERGVVSTIEKGRGRRGRSSCKLIMSKLQDRFRQGIYYYASAPAQLVDAIYNLSKRRRKAG